MPKRTVPRFRSLRQEREFWQSHDLTELFEDEDWKVAEAGEVRLESVFVSRVDRRGATLRVPGDILARVGAKPGSLIQARVEGHKVVIEPRRGS